MFSVCRGSVGRLVRSIFPGSSQLLQPVPHQADSPPCALCSRACSRHVILCARIWQRESSVQATGESHNLGLAFPSLPGRWDGWISWGHGCSSPEQGFPSQDLPHCRPLISNPSSPEQRKDLSGILFPPYCPPAPAWLHVPGLVFGLRRPSPSACAAHGGSSHHLRTEEDLHAWWGRDSLACLFLMLHIISINNATSASHAN